MEGQSATVGSENDGIKKNDGLKEKGLSGLLIQQENELCIPPNIHHLCKRNLKIQQFLKRKSV